MTGNNCLLDTNIIVEVFKGNAIVKQKIDDIETLNVPLVVVGELFFGAYKSEQSENIYGKWKFFLPDAPFFLLTI